MMATWLRAAVPVAAMAWASGCGEPPPEPASRKLDRLLGDLQTQARGGTALTSEQRSAVRALCDQIKNDLAAARGGAPDAESAERLNRLERAVDEAFAAASAGSSAKPDFAA